jgi:hypothetical protein
MPPPSSSRTVLKSESENLGSTGEYDHAYQVENRPFNCTLLAGLQVSDLSGPGIDKHLNTSICVTATALDRTIEDVVPPRPAAYDKKVRLVLQGGGALGSYQAGVYEALSTSDYLPDWVAGISIGAINAAIIAGNAPEKRVERLRAFWEAITAPSEFWPVWCYGTADIHRRASSECPHVWPARLLLAAAPDRQEAHQLL